MRLAQPMAVFGQVEFASAARNRAAILDCVEKIGLFERLQILCADTVDLGPAVDQIPDQ